MSAFNPLDIPLRPSRQLQTAIAVFTLVLGGLVVHSALPAAIKAMLLGLALLQGLYWMLLHGLRRLPGSPTQLTVESGDALSFWIRCRDGSVRHLSPGTSHLISPALTALGSSRLGDPTILLTPDNCDPDDFRRLRVLLRFHRPRHPAS